jgi:DNA-binding beta-propeller fold protein YncE
MMPGPRQAGISRWLVGLAAAGALTGCGGGHRHPARTDASPPGSATSETDAASGASDVYAHDTPDGLSPAVRGDPALVYVPNSMSNTVDVISQRTFKVVEHFATGALPQHVTPSHDLRTLWVDNDAGNSLTAIQPRTGRPGRRIRVEDPYNLYFTPDGRYALVVAERLQRLDFRTPHTMKLVHSLSVPTCRGVDHMDFSADGQSLYASCEFNGTMLRVNLRRQRVTGTLRLGNGVAAPQDVKLASDGRLLYVADQAGGGVWKVDPFSFKTVGFVKTGPGAHGLYPSRNGRLMYVSNRAEGSISVISFATRRPVAKWRLPAPASPDMGGVSADGRILWLSGRYNAEVYAIDTGTGRLRARIPVGSGPHGLAVWPQPGRYSLGHTGVMR